jgi:lipopolysaccharide biosynthesis glycosyltransferase
MKNNCFFSALTSSHLVGFKVFCRSLLATNTWLKKSPIDFLMIPIDLTIEEQKECESLYPNIVWLKKLTPPASLDLSRAQIGESAFYKIAAFSVFDYDLLISIDCSDMLFTKDISELFDYDISLGMVQGWTEFKKWQQFNGGLVLLNKHLRNQSTWEQILSQPVSKMYDQDIINNLLEEHITSLPTKYNFTKRLVLNPEFKISDASIIHYVGEKPWESYQEKFKYKKIEDLWFDYYHQ